MQYVHVFPEVNLPKFGKSGYQYLDSLCPENKGVLQLSMIYPSLLLSQNELSCHQLTFCGAD